MMSLIVDNCVVGISRKGQIAEALFKLPGSGQGSRDQPISVPTSSMQFSTLALTLTALVGEALAFTRFTSMKDVLQDGKKLEKVCDRSDFLPPKVQNKHLKKIGQLLYKKHLKTVWIYSINDTKYRTKNLALTMMKKKAAKKFVKKHGDDRMGVKFTKRDCTHGWCPVVHAVDKHAIKAAGGKNVSRHPLCMEGKKDKRIDRHLKKRGVKRHHHRRHHH